MRGPARSEWRFVRPNTKNANIAILSVSQNAMTLPLSSLSQFRFVWVRRRAPNPLIMVERSTRLTLSYSPITRTMLQSCSAALSSKSQLSKSGYVHSSIRNFSNSADSFNLRRPRSVESGHRAAPLPMPTALSAAFPRHFGLRVLVSQGLSRRTRKQSFAVRIRASPDGSVESAAAPTSLSLREIKRSL